MRTRIGAVAAATVLGIAGIGAAGCGDDDEGPLEEAGQALDEGAEDAGNAAGEAADDVTNSEAGQEAGEEIDEAAQDTEDAVEEGAEEATTDDDK